MAAMMAEPGPLEELTIAGVHLRLTQTFPPPDALSTGTEFQNPGAGCP